MEREVFRLPSVGVYARSLVIGLGNLLGFIYMDWVVYFLFLGRCRTHIYSIQLILASWVLFLPVVMNNRASFKEMCLSR